MPAQFDQILSNARVVTMSQDSDDKGDLAAGYGIIENGDVGIRNGLIEWVGHTGRLDQESIDNAKAHIDCGGKMLTPGLIDCHTHIVHAGNRAKEFEMRLNGASYEEIAQAGGGIVSTVAATRAASPEQLFIQSASRLRSFLAEGVTTVEIKSGYGLNLQTELAMLQCARELEQHFPIRVVTSFLGAHAVPAEYKGEAQRYVDFVCCDVLPELAAKGLVDAVDAFCEDIAFSVDQVEQVFDVAESLGLPIKIHAEQLSDQGGAVMAARRGALSVDHIEYLSSIDVMKLADSGTVAVLLPGAFYYLRETQLPPIQSLRDQAVPMAIASDCNPGSSPIQSLLSIMNMACTLFRMTPLEALQGVTINAARALGLQEQVGSIELGKHADMVLWSCKEPAELSYSIGANPCEHVFFKGMQVGPEKWAN